MAGKIFQIFNPKRLTMAANFVLQNGVNALSYPLHFNRSVLKFNNIDGSIVGKKQKFLDVLFINFVSDYEFCLKIMKKRTRTKTKTEKKKKKKKKKRWLNLYHHLPTMYLF